MNIEEYARNMTPYRSRKSKPREEDLPFKHGDASELFKSQLEDINVGRLKKKRSKIHLVDIPDLLMDELVGWEGGVNPYLDDIDRAYWRGLVNAMSWANPFHGILNVPFEYEGYRYILTIEVGSYWSRFKGGPLQPRVAVALHEIREESYKKLPNRPVGKIFPWWKDFPSDWELRELGDTLPQ